MSGREMAVSVALHTIRNGGRDDSKPIKKQSRGAEFGALLLNLCDHFRCDPSLHPSHFLPLKSINQHQTHANEDTRPGK